MALFQAKVTIVVSRVDQQQDQTKATSTTMVEMLGEGGEPDSAIIDALSKQVDVSKMLAGKGN